MRLAQWVRGAYSQCRDRCWVPFVAGQTKTSKLYCVLAEMSAETRPCTSATRGGLMVRSCPRGRRWGYDSTWDHRKKMNIGFHVGHGLPRSSVVCARGGRAPEAPVDPSKTSAQVGRVVWVTLPRWPHCRASAPHASVILRPTRVRVHGQADVPTPLQTI